MLCTCFYEQPNCTHNDILFLLLLTNVLIVNRFGWKRLLNALNVNVMKWTGPLDGQRIRRALFSGLKTAKLKSCNERHQKSKKECRRMWFWNSTNKYPPLLLSCRPVCFSAIEECSPTEPYEPNLDLHSAFHSLVADTCPRCYLQISQNNSSLLTRIYSSYTTFWSVNDEWVSKY